MIEIKMFFEEEESFNVHSLVKKSWEKKYEILEKMLVHSQEEEKSSWRKNLFPCLSFPQHLL